MKFVLKLIWGLLLLVVLGGAGGAYYVHQEYQKIEQAQTTESSVYALKKGTSLRAIFNEIFKSEPNPYVFRLWLRLHPDLSKVRVGTYNIPASASFADVLQILISGKVRTYSISFIEGSRTKDLLKMVQKDKRLEHKLKAEISLEEMAELLGIAEPNPEGLFMPDTYSFEDGTSDLEILKRAHVAYRDFIDKEYAKRDDGLPYKSAYEAIIMASIIEKESAVANERPLVASVFVNRLRKGMKLQTDPTVIYGVGERYKGKVLKSFLADKNPYNTYVIDGLPPTPIAVPSRAAILAALHPAKTDYLFFVAAGPDSREGHVFSKSGPEHERAVKDYRQRVATYKKSQKNNKNLPEVSQGEMTKKAVDKFPVGADESSLQVTSAKASTEHADLKVKESKDLKELGEVKDFKEVNDSKDSKESNEQTAAHVKTSKTPVDEVLENQKQNTDLEAKSKVTAASSSLASTDK